LCACGFAAEAPNPAGHWEGKITLSPAAELGVLVDLAKPADGAWSGTIDIPMQGAKGLPLTAVTVEGAKASFEISGVPGKPTFKGILSPDGNTLSGDFSQSGQTFPFSLSRAGEKKAEAVPKAEADILNAIRERVKATMPDWHVPGLALAVVKDGKVVMAEGFGVRDVKSNTPVTADTLFAIGSSTKAFTAALMGIAVDEGKIKWDEPVRTYLPDFKLEDLFATEHMTPTDLLCHRSGLPRHDIMWYGSTLSRKELYDRLHYLQPSKDFRTAFQYQNLMFMTAGHLEERVLGKPWEALVKERILDPLGMKSTNLSVADSQKAADFARPYEWKDPEDLPPAPAPPKPKKGEKAAPLPPRDGLLKEVPFRNIDAMGPAGSINSNATDMARWVRLNMEGGTLEGKTVVSKAALDEIHSPQMVIRGGLLSQLLSFSEMPYMMYGMGWMIQPYRGHRLLHHGGNIDGFSAMVSFMPDDKLGVVILSNLDGNLMADSLMFEVYDRLLGLDPIDWNGRYRLKMAQLKEAARQGEQKEEAAQRKPGTKPSHALADYAGEFDHPAYGTLTVAQGKDGLTASLHGLSSPLEHFHYDIFKGTQEQMKGLKLEFLTNLRGDIDRISVVLEDGVDPIVFKRVPPAAMRDPKFLQAFAGTYELLGQVITVELKGNALTVTVPGQPTYTLVPYLGTEFDLKDLKDYSVRFTMDKDKVTEAVFIQPNGVFAAKRK
jgi:CubicO group peptidase (beta-lactamase class C family)